MASLEESSKAPPEEPWKSAQPKACGYKPTVRARGKSRSTSPRPLKWRHRLSAWLVFCLIRVLSFTLRYKWEYRASVFAGTHESVIFCVWHNRLALCLMLYRHYARRSKRPHRLAAIVSASKDGGVVARVLELFEVQPVRGSSSRRGPQALLELTSWAERGYDLAITPDGPRGPCYVIAPGTIALAQFTGRPIVPASYHLQWKMRLKTWDRFQIPLPFSRVDVKYGDPFYVPRELSDEQREAFRLQVERQLQALTVD